MPSCCAIDRTKGEKNLFESAAFGSVVVSIAFSIISEAIIASFGASTSTSSTSSTEAIAALESVSIIATACPTLTTSSSLNNCSTKTPSTADGTSESTLSVAISRTDSSISIVSPTFLSHLITVASATLSPILGIINSTLAIIYIICCILFLLCKHTINGFYSKVNSPVKSLNQVW